MIETGFEQLFIWTSGNVRFPGLHQITFYSCLSVCNVDKTVHTCIHVHDTWAPTQHTYGEKPDFRPRRLLLICSHMDRYWLGLDFFEPANPTSNTYVCYIHTRGTCQCCSWLGPAWIVVVASQKFVSMKSCLDGNRYRFSYELYYIAKYIHKNMSSRELVISKSTRKLDKRDSRRIEIV